MRAVFSKLTSEEQLEVCRQLAAFKRVSEVVAYIKEKFGKTLHYMSVREYAESPKWAPIIEKFREKYLAGIPEVPLASKRKRMEELQKHYDQAMGKKKLGMAQRILRQAREEMKSVDKGWNEKSTSSGASKWE